MRAAKKGEATARRSGPPCRFAFCCQALSCSTFVPWPRQAVEVPLEAKHQRAFAEVPRRWRRVLERAA
jgi:hypothetical protein